MSSALIIFDCDGVLIDSEHLACRTDSACLAELGIAMSEEEILDRYVGISMATMLSDIEVRSGVTLPADFAATLQRRIAQAFETELRPMPGIEHLLDGLEQTTCVASSSTPERLRHALTCVGLFHRFAPHIFSATQVKRGKPAPDLFLFSAQQMNSAPDDCVVIEDSVAGVTAAVAAGMRAIGFTGGSHCRAGHADRLRQAGAHAVIGQFSALPPLI
ncbi:MAG TPA: HAD family hydrolase [Acetobacteraceae bacterium]|jgi:HAD superfamily hydrolase (TIGR01509 family)